MKLKYGFNSAITLALLCSSLSANSSNTSFEKFDEKAKQSVSQIQKEENVNGKFQGAIVPKIFNIDIEPPQLPEWNDNPYQDYEGYKWNHTETLTTGNAGYLSMGFEVNFLITNDHSWEFISELRGADKQAMMTDPTNVSLVVKDAETGDVVLEHKEVLQKTVRVVDYFNDTPYNNTGNAKALIGSGSLNVFLTASVSSNKLKKNHKYNVYLRINANRLSTFWMDGVITEIYGDAKIPSMKLSGMAG